MTRTNPLLTLALAAGLLAAGASCNNSPAPSPGEPSPAPPLTTPAPQVPENTENMVAPPKKTDPKSETTTVYKKDGEKLTEVTVKAPSKEATPEEKALAALSAMAEGEGAPLPKGTKALSVKIDGELATVDLSKEFRENFSGGSTEEAQTINAVVNTVGQFEGVKKVQFLVEGQKVESLGGGQELLDPLPVPSGNE
jgi:spore germination protein GerM